MSTLIIDELTTIDLTQEFRLQRNADVYTIRINLMKYGNPTGSLIITIKEGSNTIDTVTTAFSLLNIEMADDYGYGMFRFNIELPIKKQGQYSTYSINVKSDTAYDENNFYAWIKDWKKDFTNLYDNIQTDGVADYDTVKPYMFEIEAFK